MAIALTPSFQASARSVEISSTVVSSGHSTVGGAQSCRSSQPALNEKTMSLKNGSMRENGSFGPFVFAPEYDPLLREGGGTILWTDPQAPISLWLERSGD